MQYSILIVSSLSIALPSLVGLVRLRRLETRYYPFVLLLWLNFIGEAVSLWLVQFNYSNLAVYNTVLLIEYLLFLWQFRWWGLFRHNQVLYFVLQVMGTGLWMIESFLVDSLQQVNSYFLITSSFAYVVLSIVTAAKMVYFEPYQLFCNPKFVICVGLLLYASYSILVEAFLLFSIHGSLAFQQYVYLFLYLINVFVNLLFTYSVLCMPTKLRFIGP